MSKLLEATLSLDDRAEQSVWARALGVSLLARGELQEYATRKGRTRQAVSRWIAARRMYELMRECWWTDPRFRVMPHPIQLRDELSPAGYRLGIEHFVEAGEYFNKHEPDPYDCMWMLYDAWVNVVPADKMRFHAENGQATVPEWYMRGSQVMNLLGKLRSDYGAPEEVQVLAALTYEALREWMQQGAE